MKIGIWIRFNIIGIVCCEYLPTGGEVQAGSVLLPASRRGRYLANIVKRQAVDGTGIKFNKDADRMNAEAKKRVDVLSDSLLPYIIAEQERRITLYRRVMTAIQNGEKGVTIVEIRNKPPLIIRKGLMYRCPSNRAPKEPDGSGAVMCEEDIEPTPVMYDSCLSAEDKKLYVAENKYFFCNRHKVEGPDLPRNGSTVIGCAPTERTSLNYTAEKCTLEDTDDVVVHYRYYPDRIYKYVTELDPEREVCDHWAPCQVGYIYSLPAPDQALPASELWQDSPTEFVAVGKDYTSNRKIKIPPGSTYHGIGRMQNNSRDNLDVKHSVSGQWLSLTVSFDPVTPKDISNYYIRLETSPGVFTFMENVLTINPALTQLKAMNIDHLPGQMMNKTSIPLQCDQCQLLGVMLRAQDGFVSNLNASKYSVKVKSDGQRYIELDLASPRADEFGDYYAIIQNEDGAEEKLKLLSLHQLSVQRLDASIEPNSHFTDVVTYECDACELADVLCNGEPALSNLIAILPAEKQINFDFPSFQDENACVYMGIFKRGEKSLKQELAAIENVKVPSPSAYLTAPEEGVQFEQRIPFTCDGDCSIEKVSVNGQKLDEKKSRRSVEGTSAPRSPFYLVEDGSLVIRFPFFSSMYLGVFQVTFGTQRGPVTKTVLEIEYEEDELDEELVEIDDTTEDTEQLSVDSTANFESIGTRESIEISSVEPNVNSSVDLIRSSSEDMIGSSEEPITSSPEPIGSSEEPSLSSSEEPIGSSPEPTGSSEEPITSSPEPIGSSDEPITSSEATVTSVDPVEPTT